MNITVEFKIYIAKKAIKQFSQTLHIFSTIYFFLHM